MHEIVGMVEAKAKLEMELADVNRAIVAVLVDKKYFEFFSVNWKKLYRVTDDYRSRKVEFPD